MKAQWLLDGKLLFILMSACLYSLTHLKNLIFAVLILLILHNFHVLETLIYCMKSSSLRDSLIRDFTEIFVLLIQDLLSHKSV